MGIRRKKIEGVLLSLGVFILLSPFLLAEVRVSRKNPEKFSQREEWTQNFNGNFERDLDRDGVADGWGGEGKLFLDKGYKGKYSQGVEIPEIKEVETAGQWCEALVSEYIDVKSEEKYKISFWVKAEGVKYFHPKLTFYGEEGKKVYWIPVLSLPQREWTYSWDWEGWYNNVLPHVRRSGSWEWKKYTYVFRVPRIATKMDISFWALKRGGRFWVDDIRLEKYEPSEKKIEEGISLTKIRNSRQGVKVEKDYILVDLGNGCRVKIRKDKDNIQGIESISFGDYSLSAFIKPFFRGEREGRPRGISYQRCRYLGYSVERGEVTIKTLLESQKGKDLLYWKFSPARITIGDHVYTGVEYSYEWKSNIRKIQVIANHASLGTGGNGEGYSVIYPFSKIGKIEQEDNFYDLSTRRILLPEEETFKGRFSWIMSFDYLESGKGSLIGFFARPFPIKTLLYNSSGSERVNIVDFYFFPLRRHVITPGKFILFSEDKGADVWAEVYDFVYARYRRDYRMKEDIPPLPFIEYKVWTNPKNFYSKVSRDLAKIKKLGFKRIWLPRIFKNDYHEGLANHWKYLAAVWNLDISPKWEKIGEEGLKYLIEKAHDLGLEVVVWVTPSRSINSPVFKTHPDWFLRSVNGEFFHFGYRGPGRPNIVALNFNKKEVFQNFYRELDSLRRKFGVDGIHWDSYSTMFLGVIDYSDPSWNPQFDSVLKFQNLITKKLGYYQLGEGVGPFILTAESVERIRYEEALVGKEEFYYNTSPLLRPKVIKTYQGIKGYQINYFKYLANKSAPLLQYNMLHFLPQEKIGRWNRAYNKAVSWMKKRYTLDNGKGVVWKDEENKRMVLFSYKTFSYILPAKIKKIINLTENKEILWEEGDTLITSPENIYLLLLDG